MLPPLFSEPVQPTSMALNTFILIDWIDRLIFEPSVPGSIYIRKIATVILLSPRGSLGIKFDVCVCHSVCLSETHLFREC